MGVQVGDVGSGGATVWARADAPGRLWVEVLDHRGARDGRLVRGPLVSEATDFTGQITIGRLPHGKRVHYRVWCEGAHGRGRSRREGSFRTPGREDDGGAVAADRRLRRPGVGHRPRVGRHAGLRGDAPGVADFWIFSGDTVYADGPLEPQVVLADGSVWHNVVTPEKTKVAETLAEYRGQWRYNLLDENLRRLNAQVPVIAQWDDHEVTNNRYAGETLTAEGGDARYTEKAVDVMAARAAQAFHEYFPMTPHRPGPVHRKISYGPLVDVFVLDMPTSRGANSPGLVTEGPNTAVLGPDQLAQLARELRRSQAVWKVVASDMPIDLVVPDGPVNIEAIANRDPGTSLGRELEVMSILASITLHRVRNVVGLNADVHYTAAYHYDPGRAAFREFDPFWEFVAGPINAGTFGPNELEPTFGPPAEFVEAHARRPPA